MRGLRDALGLQQTFPSLCVGDCVLFLREFYENYSSLGLAVKRTGTSGVE